MLPQTVQINKALFVTPNTKLAAVLLTLGVNFADEKIPVDNTYTDAVPFKPGMPGEVKYILASTNAEGVKASDLNQAFEAMEADQQLDALIVEIERQLPALGEQLRKLLPLALASYGRGFLENRERILDLWRRARPMVRIQKSANSFALVSRNASDKTLRHCGLK